jgi:hypothetical protein
VWTCGSCFGAKGFGRYYGTWGREEGFLPIVEELEEDTAVVREFERRLARLIRWRLAVKRRGAPERPGGFGERRFGDGLTAYGVGPADAGRLLRWSRAAAERKVLRPHRQESEARRLELADGDRIEVLG